MNCPHCDQPISPSGKEKFLARLNCPQCNSDCRIVGTVDQESTKYGLVTIATVFLAMIAFMLLHFVLIPEIEALFSLEIADQIAQITKIAFPLIVMWPMIKMNRPSKQELVINSYQNNQLFNMLLAGSIFLVIVIAGVLWWML